MATKYHVQHVKSSRLNSESNGPKLPTSGQIEFGEIAINYLKDYETISIKNSDQEIVTFSSDASVNKKLETKADKARVDEIDEVVSKAFDAMNKSCGFSEEVAYTPQNELIRDCVSLSEAMEIVAEKANSPQIDTSSFATKEELSTKQDTLVSGTNIKTVNGESLLGSGDIVIQGGTGGITDAPSDDKKYVRQNANWVEETTIDTTGFATKTELSSYVTSETAESTYAKKTEIPSLDGYLQTSVAESTYATKTEISDMATQTWVNEQGFLTEHQDISNLATKQNTLVSGTNIKTINGESILGSGDITVVKSKIMTQQEYDELGEKDNNTVYFIVG